MTKPIVPLLPEEVPNPIQGEEVFNENMQAFFDALPPFGSGMNTLADWMDLRATEAQGFSETAAEQIGLTTTAGATQVGLAALQVTAATAEKEAAILAKNDAEIAKNIALAVSNMQDDHWPDLVGALPIWSAVFHNSKIWINKVAIADITTEEPLVADSIWIDYFAEISAGEVVSDVNDVADAKLPNNAWMKFRGLGSNNTKSSQSFNQSFGVGYTSFYFSSFTDGPPEISYGVSQVSSGWCESFGQSATTYFQRIVDVSVGASFVRFRNGGSHSEWKRIDNPAITPVSAGGTGEITLEAARVAMGAAKLGLIADSELTVSGPSIVGRSASGSGPLRQFSASDVRDFADAAKSGAITASGLTMATARFLARIASGTGPVQELDAQSMLAALGFSKQDVIITSTVNWVSSTTRLYLYKLGNIVVADVRLVSTTNASTSTTTYSGVVPAAYRPVAGASTNVQMRYVWDHVFVAKAEISTSGNFVLTRGSTNSSGANGNALMIYSTV